MRYSIFPSRNAVSQTLYERLKSAADSKNDSAVSMLHVILFGESNTEHEEIRKIKVSTSNILPDA